MSEELKKDINENDEGIILISGDERFVYERGKAKIFYKRLDEPTEKEVKEKHTDKGITDFVAVAGEWLERCLLGWEGIPDFNGNEQEFTSANIRRLPQLIKIELLDRIKAPSGKRAPVKN